MYRLYHSLFVIALSCLLAVSQALNFNYLESNVRDSSCDSLKDHDSCLSAGCAFCESGAVGSSCNTVEDAKDLPAAVFSCDYPDAKKALYKNAKKIVKGDSCEPITDSSKCLAAGCAFCESGAVGSSCNTVEDAKDLPAAVFSCEFPDAKKSLYGKQTSEGCSNGEYCCNTFRAEKGGCTCSTSGNCDARIGALEGAEGFDYMMHDNEVVLTHSQDMLNKGLNMIKSTPSLGKESECSVAGYLRKAGFPESTIGTMVCISKYESSWSCSATNDNTDGSRDYGLFEINSYYWCSGGPNSKYDECNASCSSLMDCQKNTNCAYKVYREQGYNAWYGYQYHKSECDSYKVNC